MNDEKLSDVMMNITAGYLANGCDGCPFYGIDEYDIKQRCDSVPVNCMWWALNRYFNIIEKNKERERNDEKET